MEPSVQEGLREYECISEIRTSLPGEMPNATSLSRPISTEPIRIVKRDKKNAGPTFKAGVTTCSHSRTTVESCPGDGELASRIDRLDGLHIQCVIIRRRIETDGKSAFPSIFTDLQKHRSPGIGRDINGSPVRILGPVSIGKTFSDDLTVDPEDLGIVRTDSNIDGLALLP